MSRLHRVAVVMDPPQQIQPAKDSSVALMLAAQERGAEIFITTPGDMRADAAGVMARGCVITLSDQEQWWDERERKEVALSDFDVVLMRKDPPIDLMYFATTWLLDQVEASGTVVLNAPRALRRINEKFSIAVYPELAPPYLLSAQTRDIELFLAEHGEIVVKPLDRMGGAFVYHLRQTDSDWQTIVERMTQQGGVPIMAQRFIPEVAEGDRRLLLIDGELVPVAAVRTPKPGEFRANLALGAQLHVEAVNARDQEIAERVGPEMREAGVCFAGLDVVGGFLTEINITSPTCIRELEASGKHPISQQFWDAVEARWLS